MVSENIYLIHTYRQHLQPRSPLAQRGATRCARACRPLSLFFSRPSLLAHACAGRRLCTD